jgi:hypothetical protein
VRAGLNVRLTWTRIGLANCYCVLGIGGVVYWVFFLRFRFCFFFV